MKASLSIPTAKKIADYLQAQRSKPHTYQNIGATQEKHQKGFDNDTSVVYLGKGEIVWTNAKKALIEWKQFPSPWTKIFPVLTPIKKGETVAVLFKIFNIWWINSARIVYTIDNENKFGFAYGTLPGHLEKGEECFWIEKDESGSVYYHIKAFSKPAYWFVWLAYPLARIFQRRFVKESLSGMKKFSNNEMTNHVKK